jgi:hypothetical protein
MAIKKVAQNFFLYGEKLMPGAFKKIEQGLKFSEPMVQ